MTRASDEHIRSRPGGASPEPRFGNITKHSLRRTGPNEPDFAAIQESNEFRSLRRRFRAFTFPAMLIVLAWYFTYAALGAYATDFMSQRVLGSINVGLLFGLGQFVTTAIVVVLYSSYVRRRIDPLVDTIRERAEGAMRR